jgi:transcriptional regulator with XRE-family HTH domain
VRFRSVLVSEFDRRRRANRRYSLRSYARDLAIDHSTLSQMLRGKRRLTGRTVRALARQLRLPASTVSELCAIENEFAVLAAVDLPGFQANSRWLATMLGLPLDDVNVTLQRLLRKRMLAMTGHTRWQPLQEV